MKTIKRLLAVSPIKTIIFLFLAGAIFVLFSSMAYWLQRYINADYSTISEYLDVFDWRQIPLVLLGDIASVARLVAVGASLTLVGQLIVRLRRVVAKRQK